MPKPIPGPDGKVYNFPDDATEQEIKGYLANIYGPRKEFAPTPEQPKTRGPLAGAIIPEIMESQLGKIPEIGKKVLEKGKSVGEYALRHSFLPQAGELGREIETRLTDPNLVEKQYDPFGVSPETKAYWLGVGPGLVRGAGELISSQATPVGLAALLSGMGEATVGAKAFASTVGALPQIARGLGITRKVTSAPFAAEGLYNFVHPQSTLEERAMGAAQAAGGALGVKLPTFPGKLRPGTMPQQTAGALKRQMGEHTLVEQPPVEPPLKALPPARERFVAGPEGVLDLENPSGFTPPLSMREQLGGRLPGDRPVEPPRQNTSLFAEEPILRSNPDGTTTNTETGAVIDVKGEPVGIDLELQAQKQKKPVNVERKAERQAQAALTDPAEIIKSKLVTLVHNRQVQGVELNPAERGFLNDVMGGKLSPKTIVKRYSKEPWWAEPELSAKPPVTPEVKGMIGKLGDMIRGKKNLEDSMEVPGPVNPETGRPNIAVGPYSPPTKGVYGTYSGATRLLKLLSKDLYRGKQFQVVTKELIQNIKDLVQTHGIQAKGKILFNDTDTVPGKGTPAQSVIISDDGPGLSPASLYKEYTEIGETTKEGLETAGKFGIATAAPLGSGRYVEVQSIINENGRLVEYRFGGSPEQLFDQAHGVPLTGPHPPSRNHTGLTVKYYMDKNQTEYYAAKGYAKQMVKASRGLDFDVAETFYSTPAEHQRAFLAGEPDYQGNKLHLYQRERIISEIDNTPVRESFEVNELDSASGKDIKTADVDVLYNLEPTETFILHYLNNGLYQGSSKAYTYGIKLDKAPKDVYLDIRTKIDPGDETHYPWPMDRESPKDTIVNRVTDWLIDKFAKDIREQASRKFQAQWDNMPVANPLDPPESQISFIDGQNVFNAQEGAELVNHPGMSRVLHATFDNLFNQLLGIADTMGWSKVPPTQMVVKKGVLFAHPVQEGKELVVTLGKHIRNPANVDSESGIFLNFPELIRSATKSKNPALRLTNEIFISSGHEAVHTEYSGHRENYAYARESFLVKLADEEFFENVWKPNFRQLVVGPDGKSLHPDIYSFLQEYDARRGGRGTSKNDLFEAGSSTERRYNSGEGQTGDVGGTSGGGSPIVEGELLGEPGGAGVPPDNNISNKNLPFRAKRAPKQEEPGKIREAYELMRGTSAAWDISAALRQGLAFVGTKRWFQAWKPMFESLGSEAAFKAHHAILMEHPVVKSGLTDAAGLKLTDLGKSMTSREEVLRSNWAEKVPGVRASNRAYTAFLNDLRVKTFADLVEQAEKLGFDMGVTRQVVGQEVKNRVASPYARQLADFINDASGRGSYRLNFGKSSLDFERFAPFFNEVLFSGRLAASRVRMLNPGTYMFLPPQIRNQYLKSLLRMGAFWWGLASFSKLMGAELSLDPTNADFGKIKFGDTRFDLAGGFQQYLVLTARLMSGQVTSSVTNETTELGKGYKAKTRAELVEDFVKSKVHPFPKFAYDLFNASEYRPFRVGDRTMQAFVPMVIGDLVQIAREDPALLPLGLTTIAGTGAQTYEKGQTQPVFFPQEPIATLTGGQPYDF